MISGLFTFGFSLWLGSLQSIWFDEAYSIDLIQRSYGDIIKFTAADAHPPLYYFLLKAWSSVFGMGEISLRAFSSVAGGLSVIFGALLLEKLFGRKTALYSLPFLVLAPFLIRYNFEIRMYALASLIGVAATYTMVRAVYDKSGKHWVFYAFLVALGMYTLYFTALLFIAHVLWLAWRWFRQPNRQKLLVQPWLRAYLGSFLLFIPWLPTFIDQFIHPVGSGVAHYVGYSDVVGILSYSLLYKAPWQMGAWQNLGILAVLVVLLALYIKVWRVANKDTKSKLALVTIYSLVPFAILTLLSVPPLSPRYLERYMSHVLIGLYLLIGACFGLAAAKGRKLRWLAAYVFIIGLSIYGLFNLKSVGNFTFERMLEPRAKQITENVVCEPGDVVMAGDPLIYYELKYYLPDCDFRFFVTWGELSERGGFAAIYGTPLQVREGDKLAAPKVHYFYTDPEPLFKLDGYERQSFKQILKYRYSIYEKL